MGNCSSMSATGENSVSMARGSVSDGTEEASIIFSNGMVSGIRVSVDTDITLTICSYPLNAIIFQTWIF